MSFVGGVTALLAGDKPQREEAFAKLTAFANGGDAQIVSAASLHVGGVEGELEDEERLRAAFSRFGSVLAVTVCRRCEGGKMSWALLTFSEVSESQAALGHSAEGTAGELGLLGGLAVRRLDTEQALGSTGAMGRAMREHQEQVHVNVAVACVRPLVAMFAAEVSRVDAAEYQRGHMVLMELFMLGPFLVGAEFYRCDPFGAAVMGASGAYVAACRNEDPSQLTREDALTWACAGAPFAAIWARGAHRKPRVLLVCACVSGQC
jgi:hypothetical protein